MNSKEHTAATTTVDDGRLGDGLLAEPQLPGGHQVPGSELVEGDNLAIRPAGYLLLLKKKKGERGHKY